jgi:hypothetical protein
MEYQIHGERKGEKLMGGKRMETYKKLEERRGGGVDRGVETEGDTQKGAYRKEINWRDGGYMNTDMNTNTNVNVNVNVYMDTGIETDKEKNGHGDGRELGQGRGQGPGH